MLHVVLRDKFLLLRSALPFEDHCIYSKKIELHICCGQLSSLLQCEAINLYRTVSYAVPTHKPFLLLCAGCNLCTMIPC